MKQLFLSIVLPAVFMLPTMAQQPEQNEALQERPDSVAQGTLFDEQFAQDKVWQEFYTDSMFNFRVLGRYARDEQNYRQLVARFERADTSLFCSDFYVLYYGYAYRDEYTGGYSASPWRDLMKKGRNEEAYKMVCAKLKTDPASLSLLSDAYFAAIEAKRPAEEIDILSARFFTLAWWIRLLGTGHKESPYNVVSVSDEYAFMNYHLGVGEVRMQSLHFDERGHALDRMEITPIDNTYFSGDAVWFDIQYSYVMLGSPNHWAKLITEEENAEN